MKLALKEELVNRLICIGDPQVQPNKVLSLVLNVLCFTAPVNSCGYVSEAGYLLSPAIKWNGQLHILGAGLNFMKFSCFK